MIQYGLNLRVVGKERRKMMLEEIDDEIIFVWSAGNVIGWL